MSLPVSAAGDNRHSSCVFYEKLHSRLKIEFQSLSSALFIYILDTLHLVIFTVLILTNVT